jgi:hypothetical protein
MARHFAQWLHTNRSKLRTVHFLQEAFARQTGGPDALFSASAQVFIPSLPAAEIQRWYAFQKIHGAGRPKLPLLLTMDVEAFAPGDIYASHTSEGDPFERLVLGRFPNQDSILERIYAAEQNAFAPWTLFIEMGALWRFGESGLAELVNLLRGAPHEIALHLHPFSLPKSFFDARALDWNAYRTGEGFSRILREMVAEFTRLWGFAPISYRSGRFDVYDGHFQALASCGLRVDSSLYQNSPYNHSELGHDVGNRVWATPEGVLEIPVSTYFDRRSPKAAWHPAMLDLDLTPLPVMFELLSRAQAQNVAAATLLAHSWSFAEAHKPSGIGKVVHFAPSQAAQEKLRWIIEFCAASQFLSLGTCGSFYKDVASSNALHDRFDGLNVINGNPDQACTAKADRLTVHSHPWQAMHPALSISYPSSTSILASWKSFKEEDTFYLELLGGNFLEPPKSELRGRVRLEDSLEILFTFRHEAAAEVVLLVFFMQYNEEGRVRNESQPVTAAADPRFATLSFAREPAAATFKIAIKLLPRDRSPGWVQLDALRLQRQG